MIVLQGVRPELTTTCSMDKVIIFIILFVLLLVLTFYQLCYWLLVVLLLLQGCILNILVIL